MKTFVDDGPAKWSKSSFSDVIANKEKQTNKQTNKALTKIRHQAFIKKFAIDCPVLGC